MEVQGKQNSTVIPGNSYRYYQATREAFFRWRASLSEQAVDPAISSGKQHDCDGRQRRSIFQGEVRATEAAPTWNQSTPSATSDPVDPEDRQCYSMLRDELILKNLFGRLVYAQHSSQQQDHEDIPGNVFFEWLGKARISEKNLINIQHFRALARFNGINVKVLVDKPITVVATEARTDTVTGRIETITVARLYQDFRAALKEAVPPAEADRIFEDFFKRTEQHRIGLCNHALRSDYFRLALMYTYGGMHSDVAVSMEDFDRNRGSVEFPLIPLKGKNGFLVRIHYIDVSDSVSGGVARTGVCTSITLMASSRQNQMILSMLDNMLEAEDRLESENMSVTSTGMITDKKYTTSDRDIMRLYQCRKEQVIRFLTNHRLKECRESIHQIALDIKKPEEAVRKEFEIECNTFFTEKENEDGGSERTHLKCIPAVRKIAIAGLSYLHCCCGENKPYQDGSSIIAGSGFPFPKNGPSIANMKSHHFKGDNSWFKDLSNPDYVDDIDCWSPGNITSQQE